MVGCSVGVYVEVHADTGLAQFDSIVAQVDHDGTAVAPCVGGLKACEAEARDQQAFESHVFNRPWLENAAGSRKGTDLDHVERNRRAFVALSASDGNVASSRTQVDPT